MHVQNIFSMGLGTLLIASPALANTGIRIAQVNNANHACYLYDLGGVQYDLSVLCANEPEPEESEVVLQTGDVQVTLRWNTADDLDLYVKDPAGDSVFYGNPSIPSGGKLDVDANLGCGERMESPVENIFWPTNGGVPGNYVVSVDLFSYCGTSRAPIDFTLTTLVRGETQTFTGSLSESQKSLSFPFTFPAAGASGTGPSGTEPSGTGPSGTGQSGTGQSEARPPSLPSTQPSLPAPPR